MLPRWFLIVDSGGGGGARSSPSPRFTSRIVLQFEHLRRRAGFCLDPRHLSAKHNSSVISKHRDCACGFGEAQSDCRAFLLLQQNSKIATMMATASPQSRTTNTPPMLSTSKAFALLSLLFLSFLSQDSWSPLLCFHHLSYIICISPFSCSSRIARDILSRHGDPEERSCILLRQTTRATCYSYVVFCDPKTICCLNFA